MNLYLDLKKAVQVPNTATDTPDDRRASRSYNESFSRRPGGVMGGDASSDDPQQGGKWSHEDALDDDLENDRKRDTQIAQERGIISKPKEDTAKSEAVEMLKSFAAYLHAQVEPNLPNETEIEYLTTQCYKSESVVDKFGREENVRVPYTREDVIKGRARIEGSERSRFNDWLQERFQKSLGKLAR